MNGLDAEAFVTGNAGLFRRKICLCCFRYSAIAKFPLASSPRLVPMTINSRVTPARMAKPPEPRRKFLASIAARMRFRWRKEWRRYRRWARPRHSSASIILECFTRAKQSAMARFAMMMRARQYHSPSHRILALIFMGKFLRARTSMPGSHRLARHAYAHHAHRPATFVLHYRGRRSCTSPKRCRLKAVRSRYWAWRWQPLYYREKLAAPYRERSSAHRCRRRMPYSAYRR